MNSRAKQVISINWFWALSFVGVRRVLVCAPTLVNFSNCVVSTLCVNRFISGKSAVCITQYELKDTDTLTYVFCVDSYHFGPILFENQFHILLERFPLKWTAEIIIIARRISRTAKCYLIFVLLNVSKRTSRRANNHRFENCAAFDMHFYWTFSRSECSKCTFYWWNVSVLQLRFR